MLIQGKWHNAGSAAQADAALHADQDQISIEIANGNTVYATLDEIAISNRLGNVERKLTFKDGSVFVTADNDAIDLLLGNKRDLNGLLHTLESHIAWVIVALLVTIATSGAILKWGIPWSSTKLAHALPHKTNELLAEHTLEFLDDYIFEENSEVDPDRAAQIRARFKSRLIPLEAKNQDINYQLHFRKWQLNDEEGIPNALALPSGDIILTDKFVELSQTADEIDAVLLHEMGHVVHRHSLQMVVQSTLLTTIIMMTTGESSGLIDMGIGVGSLLISSNYSRGHESEADEYAFKKMLQAKIDPQAFSDIMARMSAYMAQTDNDAEQDDADNKQSETQNESSILDYLSSHPNTAKRIAQATHFSDCFRRGIVDCPNLVHLDD